MDCRSAADSTGNAHKRACCKARDVNHRPDPGARGQAEIPGQHLELNMFKLDMANSDVFEVIS